MLAETVQQGVDQAGGQGVGVLPLVRSRRRLVDQGVVDAAGPVEVGVAGADYLIDGGAIKTA
ncbi:hypothetical protein [Streptosporangium sp. NPDC002607]